MRSVGAVFAGLVLVACGCLDVGCGNLLRIESDTLDPAATAYEMIVCVEDELCVTQRSNRMRIEFLENPPSETVDLELWVRRVDEPEPFLSYRGPVSFSSHWLSTMAPRGATRGVMWPC